MATPSAGDLRNFAIVGPPSSGKTTLSEAMLACAGVIGRMGNIAQGTTVSDYHVSEKQHQISAPTLRAGSFGGMNLGSIYAGQLVLFLACPLAVFQPTLFSMD